MSYLCYEPKIIDKPMNTLDIVLDSLMIFNGIRVNLFWFRILAQNALQKLKNWTQLMDKIVLKRQFWMRFFPKTRFYSSLIAMVVILTSFFLVLVIFNMKNGPVKPKNMGLSQKSACY